MAHIDWKLIFGPALLVYQMPKVGSQTVEATLRQSSAPYHIYRFHSLSAVRARALRHALCSGTVAGHAKYYALEQLRRRRSLCLALRLRRFLSTGGFRLPPLLIITAVRDVLSAALSSIFENHASFTRSPEQLGPALCRRVLMHPKTCLQFQEWFDRELKPYIGLDVFEQPFPTSAGYAVFQTRFARVLLYRFEVLPNLAPVLANFLGRDISCLVSRNLGADKQYAPHYRQVQQLLWLPAPFIVQQLNSRLMRHFYSPAELKCLEAQWLARLPRNSPSREQRLLDRFLPGILASDQKALL